MRDLECCGLHPFILPGGMSTDGRGNNKTCRHYKAAFTMGD